MGEVVIVSSVRTAVGKAPKGTLRQTRPDDMAAAVIRAALGRVPAVEPAMVDDVILGCAMPEAEQGMNMARQAALLAGIPVSAGAMTVNRYCASGLNAIALGANAIRAGEADVVVAGRRRVDEPDPHEGAQGRAEPGPRGLAPGRLPRRWG